MPPHGVLTSSRTGGATGLRGKHQPVALDFYFIGFTQELKQYKYPILSGIDFEHAIKAMKRPALERHAGTRFELAAPHTNTHRRIMPRAQRLDHITRNDGRFAATAHQSSDPKG